MDKIQELKQKMQEKYDAALAADTVEEKASLMDEFEALQAELAVMEKLVAAEKALVAKRVAEEGETAEQKADSTHEFAQAARRHFAQAANEGTPAAGGYTVPDDILTKVEKLREAKRSLMDLVSHENVKTNSGSRTFQKRSNQTGFSSVAEGAKIGGKATPQFGRYSYNIVKYGGIFAATDELLEDSDANIVNILTEWIADESRITRNKLIIATLDEKYTRGTNPATEKTISGIDDIKEILNVDLGQTFKPTSVIVTNDSGLNWLDTLKDKEDRYLLKVHPTEPLRQVLAAGATIVPVEVIPNKDLPNETDDGVEYIPMYIGDLKEAVTFFDRRQLTIKASTEAAVGESDAALNAYEEDLTLFRATEREDCVLRDEAAYFKGLVEAGASGGSGGSGQVNAG